MEIRTQRNRVVAVLGPTNTGKTHLAMERMLGHASGMIGFPLRLLARENYDRAVEKVGRSRVALITGEEKIVPPLARYFLCTVESMPAQKQVAFLAIDEIQMCADADRGHIFTDRLLTARGSEETMFMGSDAIRPLIQRLVPEATFESRPRFSTLTHTGHRKINRLPPRSVIVAFSVADVYAIAELCRRQRGGAAVVLGALSPRTRNAQVGMYQAGEVDYLVATDAIGMGLNMDVDHVAFAALRKFDGRMMRDLLPPELAQIGGRAGRHMNDGTFGTTADAGTIDAEAVARIENHQFDPLPAVFWRNAQLRFDSLPALTDSLNAPPPSAGLTRAREADDERALAALTKDSEIAAMATSRDGVRLLWEVCRIPDFRKSASDEHTRLLGRIYRHLMGPEHRLPTDWVADRVQSIDRTDGDIEQLTARIAGIRTWTYVAYRGGWLNDSTHWQERTRAVEDRLSDALHDRLTQRFVDRRTAALVGRLKERNKLNASVSASGEVMVEGHPVGHMGGFRFVPDGTVGDGAAARRVHNAALSALRREIISRVARFENEPDDAFSLATDGAILWRDVTVARVAAGPDILRPTIRAETGDLLDIPLQQRIRQRLSSWLEALVEQRLGPLVHARRADLPGPARGLVFQLTESLGSMPRRRGDHQTDALSKEDRLALRKLGVRIGRESIHMPAILKPAAVELRAILWAAARGVATPLPPAPGRVSIVPDPTLPHEFYDAVGFRVLGPLALRVDIAERIAALAWSGLKDGGFTAGPEMLTLAGCGADDMKGILAALGFEPHDEGEATVYRRRRPKPRKSKRAPTRHRKPVPPPTDSPFAKLRDLVTPQ